MHSTPITDRQWTDKLANVWLYNCIWQARHNVLAKESKKAWVRIYWLAVYLPILAKHSSHPRSDHKFQPLQYRNFMAVRFTLYIMTIYSSLRRLTIILITLIIQNFYWYRNNSFDITIPMLSRLLLPSTHISMSLLFPSTTIR